jgi:hypothetical protein
MYYEGERPRRCESVLELLISSSISVSCLNLKVELL